MFLPQVLQLSVLWKCLTAGMESFMILRFDFNINVVCALDETYLLSTKVLMFTAVKWPHPILIWIDFVFR